MVRLVSRSLDDESKPGIEAHQQDLGRIYANLLLKPMIESLDTNTIVHLQAQVMIPSGYLGAVKNIYAAVPEQTRGLQ